MSVTYHAHCEVCVFTCCDWKYHRDGRRGCIGLCTLLHVCLGRIRMFVIMHWIGMNCSGQNGIFPTRFCSIYIKSVLCFIFCLSTSNVAMSRRLFYLFIFTWGHVHTWLLLYTFSWFSRFYALCTDEFDEDVIFCNW